MKKLLRQKKGEELSSKLFILMIIAIAFLLVMVIFFKQTFDKPVDEEALCRQDIEMHSSITKWTAGILTTLPHCKPNQVLIDPLSEEANHELAEELKFCWDRWQQGKLQLFPDDPNDLNDDEEGEGIYCNPCSIITYKNNQPLEGFTNYLLTEKPKGREDTYYEYLNSFHTNDNTKLNPAFQDKILTDDDYVVLYLHAKGENSLLSVRKALDSQYKAQAVKSMVQDGIQGAAIGGGVAAAGIVGVSAVIGSAVITGGFSLIIVGVGVGVGAIWGAMSADVKTPEWASIVVMDKVSSETFKNLGCQYSYQDTIKSDFNEA